MEYKLLFIIAQETTRRNGSNLFTFKEASRTDRKCQARSTIEGEMNLTENSGWENLILV